MHIIKSVATGSPAERGGLRAGQAIVKVNGREIRDIIDWRHALADEFLRIVVRETDNEPGMYAVRNRFGGDVGVEFCSPTLDPLHICTNNCVFCFVRQMPPRQRDTLYVKDDDYRLSLIYGSFVSLTNIDDNDWQRILRERISPLYVSVHTTDPELRATMMRNPRAADIMRQLHELVEHGISVHAQLVVVPGMNDGQVLEKSIADLVALHPGVASIAVVPVGLTAFRDRLPTLDGFTPHSARKVLRLLHQHGRRLRRKWGRTIVYAADEFYVLAAADFPKRAWYDDFPQIENGVGLCRLFIDSFREHWLGQPRRIGKPSVWVTGESARYTLQGLQHLVNSSGGAVDLIVVPNRLFGGKVTVTGLLGGRDIADALRGAAMLPRYRVLLPDVCLRNNSFLDGLTMEELQNEFPDLLLVTCPTHGHDLARMTREG